MTVLYPNPCYNEVCYNGTALEFLFYYPTYDIFSKIKIGGISKIKTATVNPV